MPWLFTNTDFMDPDGFPIAVSRQHSQVELAAHSHEFHELVIVLGGTGLHIVQDQQYTVSPGDVFVITPNRHHEYRQPHSLSLVNILYHPSQLGMPNWDVRALPGYHAMFRFEPAYRRKHKFNSRLRLQHSDLAAVRLIVDAMERELTSRHPGFRLVTNGHFMQLVGFLSRCYNTSQRETNQALLRLGQVISHMEENFRTDIDLEQLADIAHMSRRNFHRVFKKTVGMTPIEYLLRIRINYAVTLLRETNISITEIAFAAGFTDSNYFSRQFKKLTTHPPKKYRQSTPPQTPTL